MATAEQIKALLRCHAEGDSERFYGVALQVAAQAAKQGHSNLAHDIRALVDDARALPAALRPSSTPTPLAQPRGELAGLLSVSYPRARLNEMVLAEDVHRRLVRVLREHREGDRLRDHGLRPRNRILLVGPPGSGKTMTASVLAGEMQMPLFTILFDGLISKFMGETAAKLRIIFEAIERTRGVYFFDEFDAIGGERAQPNDVGEIRRVLNSLLQFLEQERSTSLIVAATNHRALLDRALFRRFDDVVRYGVPTEMLAEDVLRRRLAAFDLSSLRWPDVLGAAAGLSYAELVDCCDDVAKGLVLDGRYEVRSEDLVAAFGERREGPAF